MKNNFKMFIVLMVSVLALSSCSKEYIAAPIDENYWMQKERAVVAYSDFSCDYYIVQTNFGYSVIQNFSGITPFVGDVLYGDFSRWTGFSDMYNRSNKRIITGRVKEYWLSWFTARQIVANYCGR